MQIRRLGKTELKVGVIGFGGIKLPGIQQDAATEVLNKALDLKINFFDTARGYGDSEAKIGEAIGNRRNEFFISTKSGARTADQMKRDIERSLKNLKTDFIDVYLVHNLRLPEQYETVMSPSGSLSALKEAKLQGVVKHIGFSSHRYRETMKLGIESGEFEVIMVAYNILNDELVDEDILPLAKANDIGVIVMKPLAGGALAMPPEDVDFQGKIAVSATQALRFVLANDAVTLAIPGMTKVSEVIENVQVGETFQQMSVLEKQKLIEAAEELGKEFCRGCGYCLPCPNGIKIPVILRHLGYYTRYGLKDWAKGRYSMVEIKASECEECGSCEEKCPYELPIIEKLKQAHELLAA